MHMTLNYSCSGGYVILTSLWSYKIASQMLFRGYVKLGESSPGIIRQLSLSFPNKILKVTI